MINSIIEEYFPLLKGMNTQMLFVSEPVREKIDWVLREDGTFDHFKVVKK